MRRICDNSRTRGQRYAVHWSLNGPVPLGMIGVVKREWKTQTNHGVGCDDNDRVLFWPQTVLMTVSPFNGACAEWLSPGVSDAIPLYCHWRAPGGLRLPDHDATIPRP